MGTSSSFKGPSNSTPLLPSWIITEPNISVPQEDVITSIEAQEQDNNQQSPEDNIGISPDDKRYSSPRGNFTRFVNSGGTNRKALCRAVRDYIRKASGGSRNASLRMGTSRVALANFISVLSSFQANGIDNTLREFKLEEFNDKPLGTIMDALIDFVCPNSGSVEDGIPRDAYCEVIYELEQLGVEDLGKLTNDQIEFLITSFVQHTIFSRIINDLGQKLYFHPDASNIEETLKGFINGAVQDGLYPLIRESRTIDLNTSDSIIISIYERAYNLVNAEAEGNL